MTFSQTLAAAAAETEAALNALIPEAGPAPRLNAAMRYATLGGGKRLRPFFVMETARLFGVERRFALRTGAALECVHCYSLIHDDLPAMDDDDLRRGKPTVHRAFDEATAILAGDALLTLAFEILSRPETHPEAAVRTELVLELARAAGMEGMAGGQMLDLFPGSSRDPKSVLRMQSLKTGALFRFACEAGAILAKASREDRDRLRKYADHVGLAFQIADDILDADSSANLEGASNRANALIAEACTAIDVFGARAAVLREAAQFAISRKN
jgi:farnesyl diphosphate synthase